VAVLVLVLAPGCARSDVYSAHVVKTSLLVEPVLDGFGLAALEIDLDGGRTIVTARRVILHFPMAQLSCKSGANVPSGAELAVHAGGLTFRRDGGVVETSDPPQLGAKNVVVDC
jgi:hypothetical protein